MSRDFQLHLFLLNLEKTNNGEKASDKFKR